VSIVATPRSLNSSPTVDFPAPIPPVIPSVLKYSEARVAQRLRRFHHRSLSVDETWQAAGGMTGDRTPRPRAHEGA
jgi:hypothetical protein